MLPANRKKLAGLLVIMLVGLLLGLWWTRTPNASLRTVLMPDTYARRRDVKWPHRGQVFDRNDSLLVYTGPRYLLVLPRRKWLDSARFNRLLGWPDSALEARVVDLRRRELPMQLALTVSEADTLRRHRRAWPALTVRE